MLVAEDAEDEVDVDPAEAPVVDDVDGGSAVELAVEDADEEADAESAEEPAVVEDPVSEDDDVDSPPEEVCDSSGVGVEVAVDSEAGSSRETVLVLSEAGGVLPVEAVLPESAWPEPSVEPEVGAEVEPVEGLGVDPVVVDDVPVGAGFTIISSGGFCDGFFLLSEEDVLVVAWAPDAEPPLEEELVSSDGLTTFPMIC